MNYIKTVNLVLEIALFVLLLINKLFPALFILVLFICMYHIKKCNKYLGGTVEIHSQDIISEEEYNRRKNAIENPDFKGLKPAFHFCTLIVMLIAIAFILICKYGASTL